MIPRRLTAPSRGTRLLALAALALMAVSANAGDPSGGTYYDVRIEPKSDDANGLALYRLWVPDGVTTLKTLIVRQHGCGPGARQFGREHANDIQFQALARKWDAALLGSQLWAPEEDCSTWTIPQDGSESSFFRALDQLAEKSDHAELRTVPWCLWGHSGGAMWVCNMLYRHPERVVAAFPRSGALSPAGRSYTRSQPAGPTSNPDAFGVPMLLCYGEREAIEGTRFYALIGGVEALIEAGRPEGAPWGIAVHPGSEHENSNSRLLAVRYFDAMLKLRLPEEAPAPGEMPALRPVSTSEPGTWWGGWKTGEVLKGVSADVRTSPAYTWLGTEDFAQAWHQFVTTGSIDDTTPPPAAVAVTAEWQEGRPVLRWQARADIESGIRDFRILRDGQPVGTLAGTRVPRWNPNARLHAWNYSDQPMPPEGHPELVFVDEADVPAGTVYRIVTRNGVGLESVPSEPVELPARP